MKSIPILKGRAPVVISLILTVVLALWIFQSEKPAPGPGFSEDELGVTIPQGFVLLPLNLSNGVPLAGLIRKKGVIDVFMGPGPKPVISNLRVIKLNADEGPLFGALVPDETAGRLQDLFDHSRLRGAVRTLQAGPTRFNLKSKTRPLLTEISVSEEK